MSALVKLHCSAWPLGEGLEWAVRVGYSAPMMYKCCDRSNGGSEPFSLETKTLFTPFVICKNTQMESPMANVFLDGKTLPESIFSKVFGSYFFFEDFTPALATFEQSVDAWIDQNQEILISSAIDQDSSVCIRWSDGLSRRSEVFQSLQQNCGDLFGQILCSLDASWAIQQYSPVSLGVLAIDNQDQKFAIDLLQSGYFISGSELLAKVHAEGPVVLDQSYGSGFATMLMQNYRLD